MEFLDLSGFHRVGSAEAARRHLAHLLAFCPNPLPQESAQQAVTQMVSISPIDLYLLPYSGVWVSELTDEGEQLKYGAQLKYTIFIYQEHDHPTKNLAEAPA